MAEDGGRAMGIHHLARLREMLHKFQAMARGPREEEYDKCLKEVCTACDSDEDSCHSQDSPPDVPKGYMAVYVGREHRRFVIPTSYLGLPVFRVLLDKAEEEFGFDQKGALNFPCEIETFKYILQCMERHQKGLLDDEGNPTDPQE